MEAAKAYLYDVRRFAMLERDKEYELAKRWREQGDRKAADQLVTSHLRLAVKIAMGDRGYGLSYFGNHLRRQCRPDAGVEAL